MIRVLEFADVINRYDFIDTLVHYADPEKFEMSVCVRSEEHNIARPEYGENTKYRLIEGASRVRMLPSAIKLARLLREWKIDILHAHHYDQGLIGWLATKLSPKTKLVIGRHYSDSIYRLPNAFKSKSFLAAEQIVNRHASRIIVPSKMILEILTERQGIDTSKIDVVHYGFVPEKYSDVDPAMVEDARREFGMEGRFVMANFGRLHEEKGHRYLIAAAAILLKTIPNLLVLCVGEGPERASIEKQIRELGLEENVKLVGWRTDAMTIMAASDMIVQSTLQEAFSQVMVEAMWMSKPLVITDVSGAPDIIHDGENGLLVPKADASALAGAVERLAHDRTLRDRLAERGRAFVSDEMVITKKIRDYEKAFEKAVE
jgi:L-malate glycosyltransferase